MELMFLGTGAAEAIPGVFCRCDYCCQTRLTGGRDVRTRSSFRLDPKHQIDFSPDIFWQMAKNKLDLFELEHLLITHTHEDHFDMIEIIARECTIPKLERPVYIYMNKNGVEWAMNLLLVYQQDINPGNATKLTDVYRIIPVEYFETFKAGELEVTSIKANHIGYGFNEFGLNYIVRLKDGRKLLYALDTGWYSDETWAFLKGQKIDILIMEATFGGRQDRQVHPDGHLDIRSMLLALERMEQIGTLDRSTKIYASHISHKHHLLHEEMQKVFDSCGYSVTVAYDGLTIL